MKYLYSILLIMTVFLALPTIVEYSGAVANHVILYIQTGSYSDNPEPKKARDYPTVTIEYTSISTAQDRR